MERGLNGMALEPADLFTTIDAAEVAGYDVLEMRVDPLMEFLDQGHTEDDLVAKLDTVSVRVHVISPILNIDLPPGVERDRLMAHHRRVCAVAQAIRCPVVQVVAGDSFAGSPWPTIRRETARGVAEAADVAAEYCVILAYEPLAWMPVRSLEQSLEVIDSAGSPNVGLLVDTFMVYSGGGDLDTVRGLDPQTIPIVHLADTSPKAGIEWSDDDRFPMPGDGIVPLREIMEAILETGYDGVVSDEISPKRYESWSSARVATTLKAKGDAVLASLRKTT